jgi:hypothetical protein
VGGVKGQRLGWAMRQGREEAAEVVDRTRRWPLGARELDRYACQVDEAPETRRVCRAGVRCWSGEDGRPYRRRDR